MSVKARIRYNIRSYDKLIDENQEAVQKINYKVMMRLLWISLGALFFDIVINVFQKSDHALMPVYLVAFVITGVLLIISRVGLLKKDPLAGLYIEAVAWMSAAIYMSVIHTPDQKATVLLGFLCCVPMLIIDRPWRLDLGMAMFCLVHTVLAFILKPSGVASADAVNCLGFTVLGIYLGNSSIYSRLAETDLRRRAETDKITDVLTGISNRRKLYEEMALLEASEPERPTGVIMFDIDKFKIFNDKFGHAAGDECLGRLGKLLKELEQKYRLAFYRYGGDEFVAFAYGCDRDELQQRAEELRSMTEKVVIGDQQVTVSIGLAFCGAQTIKNYERLIACADKALYDAKSSGRNQVCIENYDAKHNYEDLFL